MNALKAVAWTLLSLAGIACLASFAAPKDNAVPVGTVMAWAGEKNSVPADWMICDGTALKTKKYKELYSAIGWSWGKPNAVRFNLPDLRGRFMRGVDDGTGLDPDADKREAASQGGNNKGIGSVQDDAVQEHSHHQPKHSHEYWYIAQTVKVASSSGGDYMARFGAASILETDSVAPEISGVIKYRKHAAVKASEETRPKNASVYFIIKVK